MKKYYIIEGGNATGKSTLLDKLRSSLNNITTIYSIPPEYNILRNKTYKDWDNLSSLFFYISANIEQLSKTKGEIVLSDRSIISTFSMYLSRINKSKWDKILHIYNNILELLPPINKIFLLIANEKSRLKRIQEKNGIAKENDLDEIKYEVLKDEARKYLLDNSKINYEIIDTSNLSIEDVFKRVKKSIKNEN